MTRTPGVPGSLFAALLVAILLAAGPAQGHAVLLESDPPAGARLAEAPALVRVVLTETIDPSGTFLRVYDAEGRRIDADDLRIEEGSRPVLTVSLPELPDGAYAARWTALSTVDGHSTFGTVGFAVGGFEPPESHGGSLGGRDPVAIAARSMAYLGTALVLAAAAHVAMTRAAPEWRARTLAGGAILHAAGVMLLAVDSARDAGMDVAQFTRSDVGAILVPRGLLALAAAALAVVWLMRPVRVAIPIVVAAIVAAAFLSARLGHASANGGAVITLNALHYLSSAAWVGGLLALVAVARRPSRHGADGERLHAIGTRFGTWATLMVAVTVATGVVLTTQILGPRTLEADWFTTAWGAILVAKWILLAAMLVLAARNRFVFVGPRRTAAPGFPRSVAIEAALGALVLVLAGALTSVGAPAFEERTPAVPLQGDEVLGTLRIEPEAQVGRTSTLTFALQHDGQAITENDCGRDACIWLEVGPYGSGSRLPLEPSDDGRWRVEVLWTEAGPTEITLEVQTATVYLDTLRHDVPVANA